MNVRDLRLLFFYQQVTGNRKIIAQIYCWVQLKFTKMKRFLLIVIGWYYPNGGLDDVESSVDTEDEAIKWFDDKVSKKQGDECWSVSYQVFDCKKREVIRRFSSNH